VKEPELWHKENRMDSQLTSPEEEKRAKNPQVAWAKAREKKQ